MVKYYTRACNFYYGNQAKQLIKKKKALPLCGNLNTAFDTLEIFTRNKKNISSKFVKIKEINNLSRHTQKKNSKRFEKNLLKKKKFSF